MQRTNKFAIPFTFTGDLQTWIVYINNNNIIIVKFYNALLSFAIIPESLCDPYILPPALSSECLTLAYIFQSTLTRYKPWRGMQCQLECCTGRRNDTQIQSIICRVPNLITWVGEMHGQRYKPLITLSWESTAHCQLLASSGTQTHNLRITRLTH